MIAVRSIAGGTVLQVTITPSVSRDAALAIVSDAVASMPGVVATGGASVAQRDGSTVVEIPCVGSIVESVPSAPDPEPDVPVRPTPSARRPRNE